ncbi:MAG: SigE family RNA polymerase sigma factor [Sporichthyaceae bacterium]
MGQDSADDAEFVAFVAASQPRLTRIAYLMCGDWQRAEDVVQTVLARLYPRWSRVCAKGDPLAYVRQSLLNAVIDERRRPWRRERPVAEFAEDVSVPASDVDLGAVAALARIPARQRAVVVLRYVDGLSIAETAHELGISEGTVKSQAARGIAALRAALSERDERGTSEEPERSTTRTKEAADAQQ